MKLLSICRALSPFGIVRLLGYFNAALADYPPTLQPAVKAQFYQTRYCYTNYDEQAAFDESFAQVRAAQHPLGLLPLVVLTHGLQIFPDPQKERDWQALQRELVGHSSNSIQIIANRSGHHIQLDQSVLVIAAIKKVFTGKA